MNERAIFIEALEKGGSDQQSACLDVVCAGEPAVRQRIEALLRAHEEAGTFHRRPIPDRLADQLVPPQQDHESQGEQSPSFAAPTADLHSAARRTEDRRQRTEDRGRNIGVSQDSLSSVLCPLAAAGRTS